MDVREKLVELLGKVQQMGVIYRENQMDERYPTIEQIRNTEVASHLISNGITVQEWISVKDRLPKTNVGVLVYTPRLKNIFEVFYRADGKWEIFSYRGGEILNDEVTHWMPLPQPPKGE